MHYIGAEVVTIARDDITGLILAGGRAPHGRRRQGPAEPSGHAAGDACAAAPGPQVGALMINANRNLGAYEAMLGAPVWPDACPTTRAAGRLPGRPGALRNALPRHRALRHAALPARPGRAPGRALEAEGADIAMAATVENGERPQPVFCLMKTALMESLVAFTGSGQRKIDRWTAQHRCVEVMFDDPNAFFNANTLAELQQLPR